ncbi:hypothetical protein ACP70R_047228 [Stipagrostis hirtigluma subsp. patula]
MLDGRCIRSSSLPRPAPKSAAPRLLSTPLLPSQIITFGAEQLM